MAHLSQVDAGLFEMYFKGNIFLKILVRFHCSTAAIDFAHTSGLFINSLIQSYL